MPSAHQRKKQPEQIRRALLDSAARIAASEGFPGVTVQAVAEAAGVTKGGLFHHFSSKMALVHAVFDDLLIQLDGQIDAFMAADGSTHGCFTRAYVEAVFANHRLEGDDDPWRAVALSTVTEPTLQAMWADWLAQRLGRHASTDSDPMLEIVRLAADGAWLAFMSQTSGQVVKDAEGLRVRLVGMTWVG